MENDDFAIEEMGFAGEHIAATWKRAELGIPSAEPIRQISIQKPVSSRWKKRYGGMKFNQVRKSKQIQEEDRRLKRILADVAVDGAMLQVVSC